MPNPEQYVVHISIPETYEGLAVRVDAGSVAAAQAKVALLLKTARENPYADLQIVVTPEQSQ